MKQSKFKNEQEEQSAMISVAQAIQNRARPTTESSSSVERIDSESVVSFEKNGSEIIVGKSMQMDLRKQVPSE